MSSKFAFLAIVLLIWGASCLSCSQSSPAREEIVFDDGYKSKPDDEIIINDEDSDSKKNQITSNNTAQETTFTAKDGSEVNVMFDNYGNKVEKRTFNNNSLLRFVLLKTGVNGSQQVFVYGQNGEVKSLPEKMFDRILTASAKELANSAGIFEGFKQTVLSTQSARQSSDLKPLPSSDFPIRTPQNIQPQPEAEKHNTKQQVEEKPTEPGDSEKEEPLT